MKFPAVLLASVIASAASISQEFAAQLIASSTRELNNNQNQNQQQQVSIPWAIDYSLKYQGCHHIKQWNSAADAQNDVRMFTKRLVRYRLCPVEKCRSSDAYGCSGASFGDYIVDMDTFLQYYWNAKQTDKEYNCQYFLNGCNCDENRDEGVDEKHCQWNCALNAGMEECIEEGDPDAENQENQDQMNYNDFLNCNELVANNEDGEAVAYYVGPYCSEQGGSIKIGVFTDDQCTLFAETTYEKITGNYLKYEKESIVAQECTFCKQNPDLNNNGQNDDGEAEAQNAREFCTTLYSESGKCETQLASVIGDGYNEQACNYLNGIKMVRVDGMLDVSDARPSAVATAFIVIFAMAFAAMAFYVWYLRTRLGIKKSSLL